MSTQFAGHSARSARVARIGLAVVISLPIAWPLDAQRPRPTKDTLRVPPVTRLPPVRGATGLLSVREYLTLERQLTAQGTQSYTYRVLGGKEPRQVVRGLLLLRNAAELRPVGKNFYHDGRGNVVYFGQFARQQARPVSYSLTLLSDASVQLAMDVDGDRRVDAIVSRGLDRFGFLAPENFQKMGDCFEQARQKGGDPLKAAVDCLPGAPPRGGRPAWNDFLNRFFEPDCGSSASGSPRRGWVTQQTIPERELQRRGRQHRDAALRSAYFHRQVAEEAYAEGDTELGDAHNDLAASYADEAVAVQRVLDTRRGSRERRLALHETAVAGEQVEANQRRVRELEERRRGGGAEGGGAEEPIPGEIPEGTDPRCQPRPDWAWMYSEQCRLDPIECLRRINDPVYAATDGQCWTQTGERDQTVVRCRGNETMRDCIARGGSPEECADQTMRTCSGEGPEGRRPEACAGFAPAGRPIPTRGARGAASFLPISQLGGVISAICREAGGTGLCGDPAPLRR